MSELTLGEKSFLTERIIRLFPSYESQAYDLAGKFTREQRGHFLQFDYKSDIENAKKILDQVANFQLTGKPEA